jgi:hypothetical protein
MLKIHMKRSELESLVPGWEKTVDVTLGSGERLKAGIVQSNGKVFINWGDSWTTDLAFEYLVESLRFEPETNTWNPIFDLCPCGSGETRDCCPKTFHVLCQCGSGEDRAECVANSQYCG